PSTAARRKPLPPRSWRKPDNRSPASRRNVRRPRGRSRSASASTFPVSRGERLASALDYSTGDGASSVAIDEKEILTAPQWSVGVRLLPASGCFHHVVAHQAEHLVDLDARCGDPLHQRHGEWTVLALTVKRRMPVLRCIDDQRRTGHLHFTEPRSDAAGCR